MRAVYFQRFYTTVTFQRDPIGSSRSFFHDFNVIVSVGIGIGIGVDIGVDLCVGVRFDRWDAHTIVLRFDLTAETDTAAFATAVKRDWRTWRISSCQPSSTSIGLLSRWRISSRHYSSTSVGLLRRKAMTYFCDRPTMKLYEVNTTQGATIRVESGSRGWCTRLDRKALRSTHIMRLIVQCWVLPPFIRGPHRRRSR